MPLTWVAPLLIAIAGEPRAWEDEIVYVVILEKFWDGDPTNNFMRDRYIQDRARYEGGFWGGDLQGVRDRLDDLADLGVTSLLLYPVMQNDERPIGKFLPTGYRPKDYEQVDRNLGDEATLRALISSAHEKGMRVILDMPITLPGFEHPYLADTSKKSWFGPPSEYGVPRWKVENPDVAEYLLGVCKRWKARSGCDGFRIDSAHLQPVSFWKRFVAEIKAAPPAGPFLVLPELTVNPREIGKIIAESGFDGGYDFSAMQLRDVFGEGQPVEKLSFVAKEAHEFYPSPRTMMAPIDNYEKAFASMAKEPKRGRMKLALTYILTLDRVPLLYAGNELGVAFEDVGGAFPVDRRDSPFLKDVREMIALRKREPSLRRGTFEEILASDAVYAYLRTSGEDRILVILNSASEPRNFSAPLGARSWKDLRLERPRSGEVVKAAGSHLPLAIEPFDSWVLRVR